MTFLPIHRALNTLQHQASRSSLAVRAAVYIRNQCNCVIKYHFAPGPHFDQTGEGWLLDAFAPSCATVVDVGANVGDWSAYFLTRAKPDIVAFEPSHSAFSRLSQRFSGNPRVTICPIALSDTVGTACFAEELDAGEHSSFISHFAGENVSEHMVTVSTLDKELARRNIDRVDLLKIDCEGYDLHVLRGAVGLLQRQAVDLVQFEYNRPWREAGSTLCAAYHLLEKHGYEVFMLRQNGLHRFDYMRFGEFFEYSNFVAVSQQRAEEVEPYIQASGL